MSGIKIIGIIEICLAVILLAGAIVGGTWFFNIITQDFYDGSKIIGGFPNQTELNQFNNDTKLIITLNYFDRNINVQGHMLNTAILIIGFSIILGAIALLMLFDGINKLNLAKINKRFNI